MAVPDDPPRLLSLFYPSSVDTPSDPQSISSQFIKEYDVNPSIMLVTDLKEALIHSSLAHPAHIGQLLQAVELTLAFPSASDPRINDWHSSRPNATFLEGFHVDFRDSLNSKFSAAAGYEWSPYLGASLLGARARSIGRLSTPEIGGRIAEGLGFPGEALYSGGSDVVLETMALGACLQLLAGGSKLIHGEGKQFGQEKVLSALKSLKVKDKNRVVVEFTIRHVQEAPMEDLRIEEIITPLKSLGWNGLGR